MMFANRRLPKVPFEFPKSSVPSKAAFGSRASGTRATTKESEERADGMRQMLAVVREVR